jgi:RAD51-like protein 2
MSPLTDRLNESSPFKLSLLPLRPSTLSILNRRGFNSSSDVIASKASGGISNFAAELEISLTEASGIYREVENALKAPSSTTANSSSGSQPPQTAASILSAQYNQSGLKTRPIISFAQSIDALLGGGFQPKEVTEIVGSPGIGKTQLAMQLCVDTRLPKQFGGVEGESIYIDSEGSFSPERCADMAQALLAHLKGSVQRSNGTKKLPDGFSVDTIMDSIHVFRVYDETSQSAAIQSIPDFIKKMELSGRLVKLVIIDSIAFHYRVRIEIIMIEQSLFLDRTGLSNRHFFVIQSAHPAITNLEPNHWQGLRHSSQI